MRAAHTALPGLLRTATGTIPGAHSAPSGKAESTHPSIYWRNAGLLFVCLFFAGYLLGILNGKTGSSAFVDFLAAHYMDDTAFSSFSSLFFDLCSGAFLQSLLVLLCGFSAVGSLFLSLYFAARGAVLGLCAAAVFVQGGTRALVIHWMLTCLPDLGIFLVMLWLSVRANRCACLIFRTAILNAGHLRQSFPLRQLLMQFLTALLLCAGCCLLGAASGVLFAGVLL